MPTLVSFLKKCLKVMVENKKQPSALENTYSKRKHNDSTTYVNEGESSLLNRLLDTLRDPATVDDAKENATRTAKSLIMPGDPNSAAATALLKAMSTATICPMCGQSTRITVEVNERGIRNFRAECLSCSYSGSVSSTAATSMTMQEETP